MFSRSTVSALHAIRTTAVVANAATNSTPISVPQTKSQKLGVWVNYTPGSLTSATFDVQLTYDGTNWFSSSSPGILSVTTSAVKKFFVVDCAGAKAARLQTASVGTTTSSDALVNVSWQQS